MKQEVCLLPIQCRGCGAVFDLWHDLQQEHERGEAYVQDRDFRKLVNQSFCWHCRKVISGDADGEPESQESTEENSNEEAQLELSFSLDYEV